MSFDVIDQRFQRPEIKLECERCGGTDGVKLECSRTQYHHEDGQDDPNKPVPLCRPCAAEHHEYWDGMWAEYYSSRI